MLVLNAPSFEWSVRRQRLRFAIGARVLGSVEFQALAPNCHFVDLGTDPNSPAPPLHRLRNGIEAAIIRGHPIDAPLRMVTVLPNCIRYVPAHYRRHYIDLSLSFAEYVKKFSAKTRSTLQRKVRKFASISGGSTDVREYRSAIELREFYSLARGVSKKTYQERLLDAGLPASDEFLTEMERRAEIDSVRAYLLFLNGSPAAYLYLPADDGGILTYAFLGYDPAWRQWSPGTVLHYLALERLFAEHRFRLLDFTEGDNATKELFSTGSIACADILYFRRSLANLALVVGHAATREAVRLAARAADLAKLGPTIRRLLRGQT